MSDLDGVGVTCPSSTLAVGASMTCTGAGTAQAGQYTNIANVVGFTATGRRVLDSDPSNYFGTVVGIHLEKSTNGDDADAAPGPAIRVGDPVTWTYTVYNTGNPALTGVAVTDDRGVAVSCPSATLAAGAQMECTASGHRDARPVREHGHGGGNRPGRHPAVRHRSLALLRGRIRDRREEVHERRGRRRSDRTCGQRRWAPSPGRTWSATPATSRSCRSPWWTTAASCRCWSAEATSSSTPARRGRTRRRASRRRDSTRTRRRCRGSTCSNTGSATATRRTTSVRHPYFRSRCRPRSRRSRRRAAARSSPSSRCPSAPPTRACGREPRCGSRCGCATWAASPRTGCACATTSPRGSRTPRREGRGSSVGAPASTRARCRARQTRTFVVSARADATSRPRRICNVAVRTASGLSARRVRECVRVLPRFEERPGGVTG